MDSNPQAISSKYSMEGKNVKEEGSISKSVNGYRQAELDVGGSYMGAPPCPKRATGGEENITKKVIN